jgi:RNA polymerase sigma-70 factor (ECF subfamily)
MAEVERHRGVSSSRSPTGSSRHRRRSPGRPCPVEIICNYGDGSFFTRHRARIYRFIQRFTRDECLAEDAVSEVFLDVWRKAGSFKGECQVATWLLAIARNKTLALLRQRTFVAFDETEAASIEDPTDNPESALDKKDHSTLVQKCLKVLSPKHRQIIDLVYYQSKSIQEVAEIVGIPLNTVKTRMFYARNQLGKVLNEAGVEQVYA